MYMTTASAWEMYSGRPIAPPVSSPSDCEIIENAPPGPIRMLVTNVDIDSPVAPVMAKASTMMRAAPPRPALPTTQPSRRNRMTPRIVSSVGVNTPPNVPNFVGCAASCFSVCCWMSSASAAASSSSSTAWSAGPGSASGMGCSRGDDRSMMTMLSGAPGLNGRWPGR